MACVLAVTIGNCKHLISGRMFDAKIKMAAFLRLFQRFWCQKMWYGAILNSDVLIAYLRNLIERCEWIPTLALQNLPVETLESIQVSKAVKPVPHFAVPNRRSSSKFPPFSPANTRHMNTDLAERLGALFSQVLRSTGCELAG
uniref:Uncharacterized protein n=1 Tax=Salix viminalis TaxID=40686 RepID=A0A6N2KXV9_SALVM